MNSTRVFDFIVGHVDARRSAECERDQTGLG